MRNRTRSSNRKSAQSTIAALMEDGGNYLNNQPSVSNVDDDNVILGFSDGDNSSDDCDDNDAISPELMKVAKRFVDIVGNIDIARQLLDKIDECSECIDLIDDENQDQGISIAKLATMIPSLSDMTTNLSSMYNPNAMNGMM